MWTIIIAVFIGLHSLKTEYDISKTERHLEYYRQKSRRHAFLILLRLQLKSKLLVISN